MCLLALAWQQHADYPLVVCANRDEFYKRPTQPAHFWNDHPGVFAGRDLEAGGTWLGINTTGRFAALTNIRNPARHQADARSRGQLVSDFLSSDISIEDYAEHLDELGFLYNGYNLLLCDGQSLRYISNPGEGLQTLEPGIFTLSNASLDTPWPKTTLARQQLERWLTYPADARSLSSLLDSRTKASEQELPDTGISKKWEKALSSQFIQMPDYGTRSSTALLVNHAGSAEFFELSFDRGQAASSVHQHIEGFWAADVSAVI